jgi:hypothetical protein
VLSSAMALLAASSTLAQPSVGGISPNTVLSAYA